MPYAFVIGAFRSRNAGRSGLEQPVPQQQDSEIRRDASSLSVMRKMICALVLVPIVPAMALVVETSCREWLLPSGADDYRWFDLCFSSIMVLCTILIWRSVILWTLGRKTLTVLICLIPFVQVFYAKPLWDAGCFSRDQLRIGQEQLGIAVWIWVLVWIWWGCERLSNSASPGPSPRWRMRMNPRIRVVVASIGTLPLAVAVLFILVAFYDDLLGVPNAWLVPAACLTTAIPIIGAWLLIWRKHVRWTGRVLRQTLIGAGLLIGLPAAGTILIDSINGGPLKTLLAVLPLIGWGAWMALTMWWWPFAAESTDILDTSPKCVRCGYLLNGRTHTRCPECGDERTLDELWAVNAANMQ